MLLLSRNTSLNPGPLRNDQLQRQSKWSNFKSRGFHFIHLHVNSFLPNINEFRYLPKLHWPTKFIHFVIIMEADGVF